MKINTILFILLFTPGIIFAQGKGIISISASINNDKAAFISDELSQTGWELDTKDLQNDQSLTFALQTPGFVKEIIINATGLSEDLIQRWISIFVSYDPMNWGDEIKYNVQGNRNIDITFPPKYGAHVKILLKGRIIQKPVIIKDVDFGYATNISQSETINDMPWMDPLLPLEERVESVLTVMTPSEKMELLRESWGMPGIPRLKIPDVKKVEALHGFSYGSGATIFPQSIGLGATWNKNLVETIAGAIGDETKSANAFQAWSPVLDVAQDARWGRVEETYGEDPVLVSEIGGAWIKGFQSRGLITTPKHFGIHGAPLGGRDSHDVGLSEREIREIHLVPFRHAIENYDCQSVMMAYSDYLGIPIAKSKELLHGILREEWGFDGFIVSDCGALGNLTSRKHYVATNLVEAANEALSAGIATNCGDTYNNEEVIAAANNGGINMENLDNVCRTLLRTLFRTGLFENNPCKPLDWDSIYPGWNSPEHRELARQAARESIVLLKNEGNILPLSKSIGTIAVIGPGADDLQPGDYTPKLLDQQIKSVLTGIKAAVGNNKVLYEKGCEFVSLEPFNPDKALQVAKQADVVVMVLGDCTTSESAQGLKLTSGENHDLATLELQGNQQILLEKVCESGKPVILILQSGRPYNLTYPAQHCQAILENWLPGQEGGYATADVLFGDYNPAGRLPMTFPRHVGQLPLYYNFKTSGRRYEYSDMEYYPLYPFGYGLSYTKFNYSDLKTGINPDGSITVSALIKNIGSKAGDEVVQLYLTDMYASVKTRVMELKDFEKITLNPGESKQVNFTLTPYQFSLLNDKMDRVVEPGAFKVSVGGRSPSYVAADKVKDSVGFKDNTEGISDIINYPNSFAADFDISYTGMGENLLNHRKTVSVLVRNKGNLTDIGKIHLYVNGKQSEEIHHFELKPNEKKTIGFTLKDSSSVDEITFVTKYKSLTEKF